MQQLTVVGSPRYFKRRGTPRTPHELLEHDCIRQRLNRGRFFEWEFRINGKEVTIDVRGRLILDEMRAVLGAVCEAGGLGLPTIRDRRDCLGRRRFDTRPVSAAGPAVANRAHMPSKLRAFIEFMQAVNRKVPK